MRKTVCKLVLLLSVMILFGCSKPAVHPDGIMPDDVSGLDFWILYDAKDEMFADYRIWPGFGVTGYVPEKYFPEDDEDSRYVPSNGEYVRYDVTAWPDYSDGGRYVTSIDIRGVSDVSVFGLTVDSSVGEVREKLTAKGFTEENIEVDTFVIFSSPDGKYRIAFSTLGRRIQISAPVGNKNHIIF
ncbi:MAG: hypothetical protein IKX86_02255 [Clostridia bacterium]|nr:hypothetical protein [Clostridia bacterium]MBR5767484.1 hypothetical protein [Clostridia bacterium]